MSEPAAPAATPLEAPARAPGRVRGTAFWVALVVAGLLLLLTSFAVWVDRVALNTDVFVDTSSELLEDDEIRSAVATRAVDELFASVDVQAELEQQLPPDYQRLSGPASAVAREAAYRVVDRALQQQVFQTLWALTLAQSHGTLIEVLEGGSDAISTEGGVVTLDLRLLMVETAERIGLGQDVVDRIPESAGVIELFEADELDTAQDGFQILEALAWVLPILTLLAFIGVAWLAGDRRRAVRRIGAALVVVGILGLVAVSLVGNYIVDSLAEADNRTAASNAWDILTELLRSSFRTMIPVGILFVVASWLAGDGRRATSTRAAIAPVLRDRIWAYVALAAVGLLLLLTSSVTDFSRLLVVIVLVALGALWIELMRRQTMREVPAGSSTVLDDWRERVGGWWEERRRTRAEVVRPVAPAATDVSARLSGLADLHSRGELTDEEYAAAKARVLAGD